MTKTTSLLAFTLLATLATACTEGTDGPDTPRTPPPAAIAGEWFTGTLSTIQYYDATTGVFQDPSGEGFYFVFDADGRYETGAVINSTVAGCTARLLGVEVGTIEASGNVLTVHRHYITTHVTNTCGDDGERTQGEATSQLRWSVDRDDTGLEWLSLVHDDGAVEKYRRWTH